MKNFKVFFIASLVVSMIAFACQIHSPLAIKAFVPQYTLYSWDLLDDATNFYPNQTLIAVTTDDPKKFQLELVGGGEVPKKLQLVADVRPVQISVNNEITPGLAYRIKKNSPWSFYRMNGEAIGKNTLSKLPNVIRLENGQYIAEGYEEGRPWTEKID